MRRLKYVVLLNYIPKLFLILYTVVNIFYIIVYDSFMCHWVSGLIVVCLIYTLKEIYLSGYESVNIVELESGMFPSWVRWLTATTSLDGYVKVEKRTMYYVFNDWKKEGWCKE